MNCVVSILLSLDDMINHTDLREALRRPAKSGVRLHEKPKTRRKTRLLHSTARVCPVANRCRIARGLR